MKAALVALTREEVEVQCWSWSLSISIRRWRSATFHTLSLMLTQSYIPHSLGNLCTSRSLA